MLVSFILKSKQNPRRNQCSKLLMTLSIVKIVTIKPLVVIPPKTLKSLPNPFDRIFGCPN